MKATKYWRSLIVPLAVCLAITSCDKGITLLIINRSDTGIDIRDHSKLIHCDPEQMVSFIPVRLDHDIAISANNGVLFYDLTNTPISYLDLERNKRLIFVFAKDQKLYLMKPSDKPLEETVEHQPAGYPLDPKGQPIE